MPTDKNRVPYFETKLQLKCIRFISTNSCKFDLLSHFARVLNHLCMPQLRSSTAAFSNQKRALFCTCVRNLLENNNISIAFLSSNTVRVFGINKSVLKMFTFLVHRGTR